MDQPVAFLPENDGRTNALALQALCDQTGTIEIRTPGVYALDRTIFLSSNTRLIFGPGVIISRERTEEEGVQTSYAFVNRGAYTKTYDHDITIQGLHLVTNGIEARYQVPVPGLIGEIAFHFIQRLRIYDLVCMDLPPLSYCIHICTFEDVVIERVHIEGRKDAVHFGKGSKFVVRHGLFRTYDDPIALNAHDYAVANPQLGWIRDGLIEDCWDLADKDTVGFFARILAGSWIDWKEGMMIRHSDTVVSEGRVYRASMEPDGSEYVSIHRPVHEQGICELDGIRWVMIQADDPTYNCGCSNILFRNIHLQKKRRAALSIHFDDDRYSHSYYPGSEMPVQTNLSFENLYVENEIDYVIASKTPMDRIRVLNSDLGKAKILLTELPYPELKYPTARVMISGCSFETPEEELVECSPKRSIDLQINDCFR